ncbi:GNAT family N-acetyltransferase [Falsibacillus albus]|uniref:GNAT family N-acetyltransferase n=1 Tax=Falsibacillus albus TaxID=2478915 RepID=UPI001F2B7BE1|nr:GNAT family N-acetyltransferase [Falsibacillus albus]
MKGTIRNCCKTKEGKPFNVRTALPSDAEMILEFNRDIFKEAPFLLTTSTEFKTTQSQQEKWLQDILSSEASMAILAENKDGMIGFLDFQNGKKQRNKHVGSFGMSVKKEFRNHGIGTALLNTLFQWAEQNPIIEKINLEVFSDNTSAIQLYKRLGFEEEGLKRKAIKISDSHYSDLIVMATFCSKG